MTHDYGEKYYKKRENARRHMHTAMAIDEISYRLGINPKSFLDIGCASGSLLTQLDRFFPNTKLVGIDHGSTPKDRFLVNGVFIDIDLDLVNADMIVKHDVLKEGFDVVASIEVIEHVNKSNEEKLVETFAKLTNGVVFLSAAHPGQRGYGHVNCASREHWIQLFGVKGLEYNDKATHDFIKMMVAYNAAVSDKNLMVFLKTGG